MVSGRGIVGVVLVVIGSVIVGVEIIVGDDVILVFC